MSLSVLVVGPALLREGLRALLSHEEEFLVATECGPDPPDVVVACATTADEAHGLRTLWPRARLLLVADLPPEVIGTLGDQGTLGLFPLNAEPDELIWAVRRVAQGELVLHPSLLRALVAHLAAGDAAPPLPAIPLTARERDVLRCLTQGASDKDIAQRLFLSVRTVQSHLAHLYKKLGVHSRTEAALAAVRAGWFADARADEEGGFGSSTEAGARHPALVSGKPE